MKYLPCLNLWDRGVAVAVETGRLELQRGQWVRCGQQRPSRLVHVSERGTIWAVHPQTDSGVDSRQRSQFLSVVRNQRA